MVAVPSRADVDRARRAWREAEGRILAVQSEIHRATFASDGAEVARLGYQRDLLIEQRRQAWANYERLSAAMPRPPRPVELAKHHHPCMTTRGIWTRDLARWRNCG
jgi:hypothetical protein